MEKKSLPQSAVGNTTHSGGLLASPDASSVQTVMPLHAPTPRRAINTSNDKVTAAAPHFPSPLRHTDSVPPPSYEGIAASSSEHGLRRHQAQLSIESTSSRHRSLSDSVLHGRYGFTAEEHEMTRLVPVSEVGHSEQFHVSPFNVYTENPQMSTVDVKGPERVTITLTANMSLPYEDEVQPAGRRAGHILSTERTEALAEMDAAKFSLFHFKVCLIAGVGFFTDAYDIFAINIASTLLDFVYNEGQVSQSLTNGLKVAAPLGTFIGQLLFGWLGDQAGRKRMYGIELIIIIIGTFGQALTANSDIGTVNIYAALIVWRFVMGVGIGGDYPLSAVISSEFASSHVRGRMLTAVFANQGWGQFSAALVGFVILSAFRNSFGDLSIAVSPPPSSLVRDIDRTWRILIALGCVPAALALYFRLTIPETPRFTMDIERNVKQATQDIDAFLNTGVYKVDKDSVVIRVMAPKASWDDFAGYFSKWKNAKVLLGCAYAWFAVDVSFYGVGLNTDRFFASIGFAPPLIAQDGTSSVVVPKNVGDVFSALIHLAFANMLFSGVGLIPGYWATFALIEKWGRKRIQLIGFALSAILFTVMGTSFTRLAPSLPESFTPSPLFSLPPGSKFLLFMFCLVAFFQNFGPNTTTFIIPGEIFPTRYRSTCHGLSAASGKVGAILSQFLIVGMIEKTSTVLLVFIPFMVTGFITTLLIEETSQRTLEEMSYERQEDFILGPMRARAGSV